MTWRFWIDRGGTFTDCVAVDPGGALHVSKVLSSDDAPIRAIRGAMGLADGAPIPPCEVRMGTTLATNALLERRGADVALFVTDGFEDLLAIGDQRRPSLFSLRIERPAPLPAQVIGVASRGAPDGSVVARGDVAPPDGLRTCAVSVLHGTRCPELERAIGERLRAAGATHVSLSHEVDAEQGYLARTATTVVDAYLAPVLDGYLRALGAALPKSEVRLMQSSGTLTAPARFRGRNAVLSGPAGGVVAVAELARALGIERAIGFDMGGTSTDVCRYDGELETVYETEVAGLTLRAPAMAIHTVAAGGGSICEADGWRLTVGPHSAGADPGPIAYGRSDARAITLTDVQVALGRLLGDRFALPLDMDAPQGALREAARETYGDPDRWVELAQGFLRVAIAQMAEAVRTVTVARGHDPRDHGLIVFGGAGGQHACAVARELGVRRVLVHPLAGVQSALGMGLAAEGWHGEADLESVALGPGSVEGDARARLAAALDALAARGAEALPGSTTHPRVDLRYEGTHASFALPADDLTTLRARFDDLHARELGYARPEHPVIATTARMERRRSATAPSLGAFAPTDALRPIRTTRAFLGDAWLDVPVVHREELPERFVGPVIVLEDTGTLVVEPGWQARVIAGADPIAAGAIELTPTEALAGAALEADERDPVTLEVLGHALFSIAERMGHALQRTAMSTNIRERLDFSCAIFDADGMLVTNAPHIPVHLGAMGETVRAVFERHPRPEPGDVFVSNDPALGGSHLPDITVVSPVFDTQGELRFFTASRGHHADVGGITPGSMPAFSTRIEEEGVVFRALRIVRAGRLDRDAVRAVLDAPPYP
ncbi:MAG: hydantoinase/oxoprolinase family protein, partial [Sandaracinaceae bacterium]